jgi:peptidylprolyl isomerase
LLNGEMMLFLLALLLLPISAGCDQTELTYPVVVLETTAGSVDILLFRDVAPKACENFITLAQQGFYNGILFHRIIPKFMIQGGDPTGTGTESISIYGDRYEDEFSDKILFDRPGRVGLANAGPNSNGSQFFITLVPTPWKNKKHTVFGQVIRGFDTLKKLESCGSQAGYVSPPQSILRVHFEPAPYTLDEEEAAAAALH